MLKNIKLQNEKSRATKGFGSVQLNDFLSYISDAAIKKKRKRKKNSGPFHPLMR